MSKRPLRGLAGQGPLNLIKETMRYTIEYLEESTDEFSICHSVLAACGDLDCARLEGWRGLGMAARRFEANGFQIRDVSGDRTIQAIETIDLPLAINLTLH